MKRGLLGFALITTTLALAPATASAGVTITVSTTADQNDAGAECSLREAIQVAVTNQAHPAAGTMGCNTGAGGEVQGTLDMTGATTDAIVLPALGTYTVDNQISIGAGGPVIVRSDDPAVRRTISMPDDMAAADDRPFQVTDAATNVTFDTVAINNADEFDGSGGGVIYGSGIGSKLTLKNSVANSTHVGVSAVNGGVIRMDGAASDLTIDDSVITGGEANQQGGGIYSENAETIIRRSVVELNQVTGAGTQGGGISQTGGSLTIADSEIRNNTIAGSSDAQGGGIRTDGNSSFDLRRSLVADNAVTSSNGGSVQEGGGIYTQHTGNAAIVNSTIYNNTAGDDAGGSINSQGGGIVTNTAGMTLTHDTFLANTSIDSTGEADHLATNAVGTATYKASLFDGADNICGGLLNHFTSGGFNAFSGSDPECATQASDNTMGPTGVTAGIGTNGGPVVGGSGGSNMRTAAIGSPGTALDLVPLGSCPAAPDNTDQRGVSRPQGTGCDAGAFEVACTTPANLPGCPPLPMSLSPAAGPTGLPTATRKKCKKGRKLKRGKCVKRNKKKK
jgi:CSLREA domain-containing protein